MATQTTANFPRYYHLPKNAAIFALRHGGVCSIQSIEYAVFPRDEPIQAGVVQNTDQLLTYATAMNQSKINTTTLRKVRRSYDSSNI